MGSERSLGGGVREVNGVGGVIGRLARRYHNAKSKMFQFGEKPTVAKMACSAANFEGP